MIWALVECHSRTEERGIRNPLSSDATLLHWTDIGVCSWYNYAIAIQELAIEKGMLGKTIPVRPIPASAFPTHAASPSFSVIDKTNGIETICWRKQLSEIMDELKVDMNNS
jgi:dTDP-4-dehydrorhamnose reductase